MSKSIVRTILIAGCLVLFAIAMIMFPREVLQASTRGLNIWWGIVFPSLLPFFIVSELLICFGVVHFLGILLEPLMRFIFRVPGISGFVLTLGMASGFPAGAKITSQLRKQNKITRTEAERLIAFTNSANPLFIFGAVAVGFFHQPQLGIILAIAHYGGNLLVGLLMRFYKWQEPTLPMTIQRNPLKSAVRAMQQTQLEEKRPFGKLLGDTVVSSVNTLLMIGGFIIFFSVLNRILFQTGIISTIASGVQAVFSALTINPNLSNGFIAGFFEITLGTQLTSNTASPLLQQLMLVSFMLGFSGLSVHAQVASLLAETDIRYKPFLFGRILHGIFSVIIIYFIFQKTSWSTDVFRLQHYYNPEIFFTSYGPILTIIILFLYLIIRFRQLQVNKNH